MKNWWLCFFLLVLGVFSQATWCSETPEEAITRIYHSPEDRMNYDTWLRGEMAENHRTASIASRPLFDSFTRAQCFCNNPNAISVEIRQATSFSNDKYAEADIILNEKNRSRSLTLHLHKLHDRWLIVDIDNTDDSLPSLGRQLREDTELKLLLAPQLATDNHKIEDVAISELLANPDKYHSRKVRVRGRVFSGFEQHAIYDDPQKDGLWLENVLVPYTVSRNRTGESMAIEGTFDMRVSGHLDQYPGGITNITRYEKVDTQAKVHPIDPDALEETSFYELLQHPDKYHQKKVRLRGYAILGFEHAAIYANKDEIQREKGFWLGNIIINIPRSPREDSERKVLIEGIVNKDRHGHMGLNAGEITDITRYEATDPQGNITQLKSQGAKE